MLAPTSQMRALRELEPPSADEGFADVEQLPFVRTRRPRSGARASSSRPPRCSSPAGSSALEQGDPRAPHLVFDWSPDGTADALAAIRRPPRGRGLRAGRERALPAPRRPADLLVPAAASGPAARVRARTRRRPGALDAHRHRAGAPDARDDARRPLRRGLSRLPGARVEVFDEPPSSPVLRTTQCVSCLTTSISISGV